MSYLTAKQQARYEARATLEPLLEQYRAAVVAGASTTSLEVDIAAARDYLAAAETAPNTVECAICEAEFDVDADAYELFHVSERLEYGPSGAGPTFTLFNDAPRRLPLCTTCGPLLAGKLVV